MLRFGNFYIHFDKESFAFWKLEAEFFLETN